MNDDDEFDGDEFEQRDRDEFGQRDRDEFEQRDRDEFEQRDRAAEQCLAEKARAFAQQAGLRTVLFVDPRTGRHCSYDSVFHYLTENAAVDVDERCGLDIEARRTAAAAVLTPDERCLLMHIPTDASGPDVGPAPGTNTHKWRSRLHDVRTEQRNTRHAVPLTDFIHMLQSLSHICGDDDGHEELRWSHEAIDALRTASEHYVVQMLVRTNQKQIASTQAGMTLAGVRFTHDYMRDECRHNINKFHF